MANSKIVPNLAIFQWQSSTYPAPALAQACLSTDTVLYFEAPPLDHTGAVITKAFLMGIQRSDGYVETVYVPANALSVNGLTATGVTRGIALEGLDYTTGVTANQSAFPAGALVYCNVSAVGYYLLMNALLGNIATGGSSFSIGTTAAGNIFLYASNGATNIPFLEYNGSQWVYSNDGVSSTNFGTGAGLTGSTYITISGGVVSLSATAQTTRTPSAVVITDASSGGVNSALLDIDHVYYPLTDVIGETVAANALVYQRAADLRWYNITSSTSTQFGVKLAICLDSATVGQTGKRLLKEGSVAGLTFSNINPTFTTGGTSTNTNVGDATTAMVAGVIDNTGGAEAVISGAGTISIKKTGSPAGAMAVYLVLEQQDQSQTPACYWDASNTLLRGCMIAQATIPAVNVTTGFSAVAFTLVGTLKIPAGVRAYLVMAPVQSGDASNYYTIQSGGTLQTVAKATQSTWSGTPFAANYSLAVTSTSPVGYALKAYTGTNGSYGITPSSNPWSRCIGKVTSTTTAYFNGGYQFTGYGSFGETLTATSQTPVGASSYVPPITLGFCPSEARIDQGGSNVATATAYFQGIGYIRGDLVVGSAVPTAPSDNGTLNFNSATTFTGGGGGMFTNGAGLNKNLSTQNYLHIVRLENGVIGYVGYPLGANYVSVGASGFSSFVYNFTFFAQG